MACWCIFGNRPTSSRCCRERVIEINGELTDEAHQVEDLTFTSDSDQLKVNFEAIHKGYFLGGDMWRGRLIVGPDISPGEYNLAVLPKRTASPRKAPAFRILVFPGRPQPPEEFHLDSPAVVRGLSLRRGGRLPAGDFAGLRRRLSGCPGGGRRCLAASGQAEVYQVTRGDGGYEIRFGLGTAHGMSPGARVAIYDEMGQQVGTGTVEVCNQKVSVAQATSDQPIKAGYLVSRV